MKKLLTMITIAISMFALVACGNSEVAETEIAETVEVVEVTEVEDRTDDVIWTVQAKITDRKKFYSVMKDLIGASSNEAGTIGYEWTIADDNETVHVYERYANSDEAIKHVTTTWAANGGRFSSAVEFQGFAVFNTLEPRLAEMVAGLQPLYMTPFAGFSKPRGNAPMNDDIVWAVAAKITDKDKFEIVKNDLIAASQAEAGTVDYWWTIAEDGETIHVYERYENADEAIKHVTTTWAANSANFVAATEFLGFEVYSDLSPELAEMVAGLQPVNYTPFGGFAK